jgi:hypothetical protein
MKQAEHYDRIKKMNRYIKSGNTGTPSEFANYMDMSQSHLFRCLLELARYGIEIQYSRSLKTYFHSSDKELTFP